MKIIFDLETDGLLENVTKVHCGVIQEVGSKELHQYELTVDDCMLEHLYEATTLIGHNILGYDLPVLKKLYGWEPGEDVEIFDTQIMSRLIWPDIGRTDKDLAKIPQQLWGKHSLESWGHRLGILKGDFGKQDGAWDKFTPEMLEYCEQDVRVTKALYELIISKNYSPQAIKLEHDFAAVIHEQEQAGFEFDVEAARELEGVLREEQFRITEDLKSLFPAVTVPPSNDEGAIAEWNTTVAKAASVDISVPFKGLKTKPKVFEFNANSRQHIAFHLWNTHGWTPKKFSPSGQAQIDEQVLGELHYPEAKALMRSLLITKRLGMLTDGANAWLKLVKPDGRIHGKVITNGAVTGRCAHYGPNVAQVPSVDAPFGPECRSLFKAREGWKIVGCDAAGLELRCLAHYLKPHDNGEYMDIVVDGDIHTANQEAAGLPTRRDAKTFIYAWLYGAGDKKLGSIVGGSSKDGKRLKEKFFAAFPAIKLLKDGVTARATEVGHLKGIDGRLLPIRSPHAALNTLLQSAGAVLMKQAVVNLWNSLKAQGLRHGVDGDYCQVAMVHDEIQLEVREEYVNAVAKAAIQSICESGAPFKFRCRLDAEAKQGRTWADTH